MRCVDGVAIVAEENRRAVLMARKLIRTSVMLLAISALLGVVGCSCHKSTSYDGDCGLVYDNDYWQGDCGGCGAPSGHVSGHGSGCGGCGSSVGIGTSSPNCRQRGVRKDIGSREVYLRRDRVRRPEIGGNRR